MFAEAHLYPGVALAGLVSFLSPCVLPLVPPYLGFIGGTTIDAMTAQKGLEARVWRRVVIASLFFVLGFTTVFIALGATASALGQFVQQNWVTWRAR
jgi:cytochrome c-type biogenesis protein